ncbi:biotin transporter BioY [Flavonifractor sp. An100]|uniref:biotin transporter BioY n=1 Tax=Flavonifractor sp. An100 TaxID=1965538 RepID=UPI000B37A670|nr:biotin transporter BioY [Flavonifractor sp. An100]OUQ81640.1 biotin transporter BioY [Flavonifractor sp. An100]
MEAKTKYQVYPLAMTAVMAAVTCVLGPMSISVGVIPVSFTNLAIYLSLYILGWKRGSISYLVYMLIGMVGMPVFSGYAGGFGKLFGPTGGYILGFLPMAIIAGWVIDHSRKPLVQLAGMILGTAVCYAFGTAWFCVQAGYTVGAALSLCVFPFIPVDIAKMVIAMGLGTVLRSRLEKAGLLAR